MFSGMLLLFLPIVRNNGAYSVFCSVLRLFLFPNWLFCFPLTWKLPMGGSRLLNLHGRPWVLWFGFRSFQQTQECFLEASREFRSSFIFPSVPTICCIPITFRKPHGGFPGVRKPINPSPDIRILGSLENQEYRILLQACYWSQAHWSKRTTQEVRVGWKETLLYFACWPSGRESGLKSKSHLPLCQTVDKNFWRGVSGGGGGRTGGGRGLLAETAQSAPTVILKSVISGQTSIVLF